MPIMFREYWGGVEQCQCRVHGDWKLVKISKKRAAAPLFACHEFRDLTLQRDEFLPVNRELSCCEIVHHVSHASRNRTNSCGGNFFCFSCAADETIFEVVPSQEMSAPRCAESPGAPRSPPAAPRGLDPMQGKKEDAMRVSIRGFAVLIALALGLALAAPTFAKGNTTTFNLGDATKVAGKTLPPGEYQVAVDGTTATFKHNGKVVAEVKGEWKKASGKEEQNSIVRSTGGEVLEIHLQGRDSYFVVG
jgi:hypothetical protein